MDNKEINENKLYSISFVADLFDVTKPTLRSWDRKGFLKAIRTGGNHRRYKGKVLLSKLNSDT